MRSSGKSLIFYLGITANATIGGARQDLMFNVKRHRNILWEIRELWRSIHSLFQRRALSKDIDNSLEKALDKLRESLD